jgi:putative endonuclease
MLNGLKEKGASASSDESHWFLYILKCSDGTLYTGITNDLTRRTQRHNDGKGARYTRTRRPVTLVYYETCESRSAALIREAAVKSLPSSKKRDLASK